MTRRRRPSRRKSCPSVAAPGSPAPMCSSTASLIRRFIDPRARFKFVAGVRYSPQAGEIRFDMPRGEYTHEGDRCTFEVLCARFGLRDAGLTAIGEIVHDIDLKEDKFSRPEVDGIVAVLRGIRDAVAGDADRVQAAASIFDGLYAQFRGTPKRETRVLTQRDVHALLDVESCID